LAYSGAVPPRRPDSRYRHTWCGHAGRCHNKIDAAWCKIALRSPPCSLRGFVPLSAYHGVCWGGGLNKYQFVQADAASRHGLTQAFGMSFTNMWKGSPLATTVLGNIPLAAAVCRAVGEGSNVATYIYT